MCKFQGKCRQRGTTTPGESPATLNFNDVKTILEEHKTEMNKAMNTSPKTVEKKVLQELECRKLLSPRIIEGDLDEALTDSDGDNKQDPNNENSTEHMKMNMNLPKTGK